MNIKMSGQFIFLLVLFICCDHSIAIGESRLRARDLGVMFDGTAGPYNAITDVPGIQVGYKTRIEGEGKLVVGKGPVRTGVTIIMPYGQKSDYYPCGYFSLNGDADMSAALYIDDYGMRWGPIGITNTNSAGVVRDAIGEWNYRTFSDHGAEDMSFGYPIVGETWDGDFNDINGFHISKEDVFDAIAAATSGPIAEGNVGGGTGMWLYGFKGGTGTSSRLVKIGDTTYTVGVLVQANLGRREDLTVTGVPVGKEITELQPVIDESWTDGSIFVVIGTDAPMLSLYLKQLAKRGALGLARTGTASGNGSGDVFLAFSTSPIEYDSTYQTLTQRSVTKWSLDPLYRAAVQATEEAIVNVLVAAETLSGVNGNTLYAIPHERLREVLKKYNRLKK
ncbi:MAG: P1 family peptidase [Candidatus Zixiibacteriota bacterium]